MAASDACPPGSPRGRPHLGPRTVVTAALWRGLENVVDGARGPLDRSPFLADLLAWHVDRPDLMRHPELGAAFERPGGADAPAPPAHGTKHCTVRVHPAVAAELVTRADTSGLPRAVYNAYVIAELLGSASLQRLSTQEGLPLAM
ncbi:hypothetical protein Mycch_6051 (plasmid) [Mycolicibacterium chubuense NBB4]|uniref:Uncharacterized protein n=1 Tax=Mycolicibacterium chubuense (strain NBB4) TaxID=710421 RepID=I4BTP4_MYCCN|nr:hypothetical protein [Mycolicibacterium chubuense]AFM20651.1 hypothetical protein Mycch_6051 [Mycolicibacterium chubuense NBB4]